MADSTSPAESLSARFGEWFKSQPEAQIHSLQALDDAHLHQPLEAAKVHGVKGPNDRVTPILYDFDSKYAIEDPDSFTDGEVSKRSSSSNSGNLHKTKDVNVNDINAKARKVLGMDPPNTGLPKIIVSHAKCTSPSSSSPAQQPSIQPDILPPAPAIILLPNKKPWTKTHIRTLIILSLILQAGIIAITVSIVLCTQATQSGGTTDGGIITGVVGCATIICGLITGYDMLIAEYTPSQHQHHRHQTSAPEPDIEKGIHNSSPAAGPATKSLSRKFSNKELSIDIHAANAGRHRITHHQLPHNVIYNSRLSNPFPPANPPASPYATSLTSQHATSLTTQYANSLTSTPATSLASPSAAPLTSPSATSLTSPRTRTARRLTPRSPLPYSPSPGSIVPSPSASQNPSLPESWAQKLETRVRPLSKVSAVQRLSTLKEEEDEVDRKGGKEGEEGKQGKEGEEGKKAGGRDSATSRILSLYEGMRSWPASPVVASVYEGMRSWPASPVVASVCELSAVEKGGRRASAEGVWGRYTPLEEGGRRGRSWA